VIARATVAIAFVAATVVATTATAATVPRDGAWAGGEATAFCTEGGDCDAFENQGYTVIRNRTPRATSYQMILRCQSRESGARYDVAFMGRNPTRGRTIPPRGVLRVTSDQADSGLSGRIAGVTATFNFARRGMPQLQLLAELNSSTETCTGRAAGGCLRGPLPRR
jgi:hypothetical protein